MKKVTTKALDENLKEWASYNEKLQPAMTEFTEIKRQLLEPRMSISQMCRILGIGPSVVLNWHSRIMDKFSIPRPKKQKWAHFSLSDLLFYEIVKEVKKRGIDVEKSMGLYQYIRNDFIEFDNFVHLARGTDYMIIYDFAKSDVFRFRKDPFAALKQLATIPLLNNYYLTIPIGLVIRKLLQNHDLQKIFDDSFRISVLKDGKLDFIINKRPSILKSMPDKPLKWLVKNGVPTLVFE